MNPENMSRVAELKFGKICTGGMRGRALERGHP